MYIGSSGPNRLLNITPTKPPLTLPALDLLTRHLVTVLEHSTRGLVVEPAPGYYHFEPDATTTEETCSCGVTAPGKEYYIRDLSLFGCIVPALGLHYLTWHRSEVPQDHMATLRRGATDALHLSIGRSQLEPPELSARRATVQRAQAGGIIRHALDMVREENNPRAIGGILAVAIHKCYAIEVGWLQTQPRRTAILAVFVQLHPEDPNQGLDYMLDRIITWASSRTLAQVEQVLQQAIEGLEEQ
jgi:hypothetical protein